MRDLALQVSGATLTFVTGQHSSYPCTNIIRDPDSCWISSGSFPQSFVVSLQQSASIEEIAIESYNIKTVILESSTSTKPEHFQHIGISDFQRTDGTKQLQPLFNNSSSKLSARHIKITVTKSFDHFVAVYHLKVIGSSGGNSPAKFSASQMGIGNGTATKQDINIGMTNGGFGNSFSTQPIKVENKFDGFQPLQAPSTSNRFQEKNNWDSQETPNNENWNLDEVPVSTSSGKWDNDEEPVVFGRDDNGAFDNYSGDESTEENLTTNGLSKPNHNNDEPFQNDDSVQGFVAGDDSD